MAEFGKLNFAVSFNPQTAFPLDARSYFDSLEAAKVAAASAAEVGSSTSTYYFGQTIVVVDGGVATSYIIQPDHSLSPLAQDNGEAVKVAVDEDFFKYDSEGKLTFATAGESIKGYYLGINSDNRLDWIKPIDAYTKAQTDAKIAEEIAKADHLSRKVVESVGDIDIDADDAQKYIYMVPREDSVEGDHYDEYMVIEIADTKVVEKVGDWAVDLSGYATTTALENVSSSKVDKVDGSRLMTEAEGAKIKSVEEGAQKNLVNSVVESELNVDETGKLGINAISQDKVTGLTSALNNKVDVIAGYTLLSPSDQEKLSMLTVGDSGNLEVSGTVNAENVKGLEDWITTRAGSLTGLSENNFSSELKAKLEAAAGINSVSEEFTLADGELSVKSIDKSKISGLNEAFASKEDFDAHVKTFTDYQTTINNKFTSVESRIKDLEDAMTWKDISE